MKTYYLDSESLYCYLSLFFKDMALVNWQLFYFVLLQRGTEACQYIVCSKSTCRSSCQSRNTSTELKCYVSFLSPLIFPSFAQVLLEGKFTGSHQHCKLYHTAHHHSEVQSWKESLRLSTKLCSKELLHLMELSQGLPPPPALWS